MRPTILLYDIDGTLISAAGAGRRSMEHAFETVCGRKDVLDFPFDGMTDQAIVRQGLLRAGRADEPEAMNALLSAYLQALRAESVRSQDFRVHAGVTEALALTAGNPRFAVGLGTGNVREGAAIKLGRVSLYEHFAFGGFGCDHIDRPSLLRIGAARGADALGKAVDDCRVVVIGDTPKDIAAAHAIGAECIAVATGSFAVPALQAHGPAHALSSLEGDAAAAAILG